MITNALAEIRDYLHALACYQLFITPIHMPLEKQYRGLADKACQFIKTKRTELINLHTPRHHVIHHFSQPDNPQAKKVLITHGWLSRSAYMVRFIRALHQQGFDVYALDFPAHGESKGFQLTWTDAVVILRQVLNDFGPFYGAIGHSFGGSMLLNTLNLGSQFDDWSLKIAPEKVILIASPTRMRTPVSKLARRLKLTGKGYLLLREVFRQNALTDIRNLDFRHLSTHSTTPFLCIHGENDDSITPIESRIFCDHYPHASLAIIPGLDHVNVLFDKRVEDTISQFLNNDEQASDQSSVCR